MNLAFFSKHKYLTKCFLLNYDKSFMKAYISILLFCLSSSILACEVKNLTTFISTRLDVPTIANGDIQKQSHIKDIVIAKYTEGCGIMGCSNYIFKKIKTSCYSFLGTYHGILIPTKKSKNNHPEFELSFKSGHKMKVFFDPKTKKYTEE